MLLATVLVLVVGVRPAVAEVAPGDELDTRRLDAFVLDQQERTRAPGIAYAVVGPAGIEHSAQFGTDGDGAPVDEETPFLWGSVAKPVAATLAVLLADTGRLELDARVTDYLPDFRVGHGGASDAITVRQLLTMTSGIGEWLDLTDRHDAERRPTDVLPELRERALVRPPGAAFGYSSVNYLVLAAVIEAVTGTSYAEALTRWVLAPAGMAGAITTPTAARDRLPPGHRYVAGRPVAFDTDYDPAGVSYGYLGGDLRDLAAFGQSMLSDSTLLDDTQRATLLAGEVEQAPGLTYGLGWRQWPVPGSDAPMVWHSGAAPGYATSLVVLPELDRAVVVLTNAYGSFQEEALLDTGWGLASLLSGAEPEQSGTDPTYAVLLGVLGLVVVLLLALAVRWTLARRRPRVTTRRRTLVAGLGWVVALSLLGIGLALLPSLFGVGLVSIGLWAPDVGWLLWSGIALTLVLIAVRSVLLAGGLRTASPASAGVRRSPPPGAGRDRPASGSTR